MFDELVRQKIELASLGGLGRTIFEGTENPDLCLRLVSDDVVKLHRTLVRVVLIKRRKRNPVDARFSASTVLYRLLGNICQKSSFCFQEIYFHFHPSFDVGSGIFLFSPFLFYLLLFLRTISVDCATSNRNLSAFIMVHS